MNGLNIQPFGSEIKVNQSISVNMIVPKNFDEKSISSKRKLQLIKLQKFRLSSEKINIFITQYNKIIQQKFSNTDKFSYVTKILSTQLQPLKYLIYFPLNLNFQ